MLSTVWPYIAMVFAIASLGVSFLAMQFALTNKRSERDFRTLLLHLNELEDMHEALAASHKRLRSRVGMRELRARRSQDTEADLQVKGNGAANDPDAWKKEMRLKLHRGEVKP